MLKLDVAALIQNIKLGNLYVFVIVCVTSLT